MVAAPTTTVERVMERQLQADERMADAVHWAKTCGLDTLLFALRPATPAPVQVGDTVTVEVVEAVEVMVAA